jgi:hypothetical protein
VTLTEQIKPVSHGSDLVIVLFSRILCNYVYYNRRLNSGKAYYHLAQNLLSFLLLSEYVNVRIYKIIILPLVLNRYETWSLTLREGHRLRCLIT